MVFGLNQGLEVFQKQGAKELTHVFMPSCGKLGAPESSLDFSFSTVYPSLGNLSNRLGFKSYVNNILSEERGGNKTKQNTA